MLKIQDCEAEDVSHRIASLETGFCESADISHRIARLKISSVVIRPALNVAYSSAIISLS